MGREIINKVAGSGLITLEMKDFQGDQKRAIVDIKNWLYKGLILKEKEFRAHLKNQDWELFSNQYVAIDCSVDTIIPVWAYMLVAKYLKPFASKVILGNRHLLEREIFEINIKKINTEEYIDKRILIKGCSNTYIPEDSYVLISEILMDYAKSLMFGEACSNVPIFKKKNQ
jgi:hypothetical protein